MEKEETNEQITDIYERARGSCDEESGRVTSTRKGLPLLLEWSRKASCRRKHRSGNLRDQSKTNRCGWRSNSERQCSSE